jgi:hypothetical protein
MAFQKAPLDERVRVLLGELGQALDERAKADKQDCPGVPEGVIRNLLTRGLCPCEAYLAIQRQDDEAKARGNAA